MLRLPVPRRLLALTLVVGSVIVGSARAMPMYSDVVVFGDSLSDTGNVFLALEDIGAPPLPSTTTPVPIPGNGFIADAPYVRALPGVLPAFSNGLIWAERVASALGVGPLLPSLLPGAGGTNFAFGGATLRDLGATALSPGIGAQIDMFIERIPTDPLDPADSLFVLFAGGNDVRDAVNLAAALAVAGATPAQIDAAIGAIIGDYAVALADAVSTLAAVGARDIVIFGLPDVGLTPALLSVGPQAVAGPTFISEAFIDAYSQTLDGLDAQLDALQLDEVNLLRFDLAALLREVAASPGDFGLTNATDACAASQACLDDPRSLFFDGIHPTAAANAIIADRLLALVAPVPAPGNFCAACVWDRVCAQALSLTTVATNPLVRLGRFLLCA